MNIILTGLRGTGKTSIGRRLAELLSRSFVDTDTLIKEETGLTVQDIVTQQGWEGFRDLEHRVACRVATLQNAVISTGGGMLTFERNRAVLKPSGIVVLLYASPARLAQRIQRQAGYGDRPRLTNQANLEAEFHELWREREVAYREVSDLIFSVEEETENELLDIETKAQRLKDLLKKHFSIVDREW